MPAFTLDDRKFPTGGDALVAIWKHDCPTCEIVMPVVDQVFAGSPVELISVSQSDGGDTDAFVSRHGLTSAPVRDADLAVSDAWDIDTVPTLFLTDGAGEVRTQLVGWDADAFTAMAKEA